MKVLEAIATLKSKHRGKHPPNNNDSTTWIPSPKEFLFHGIMVLMLDILLIYYLAPAKSLICLILAGVLWAMTLEDYKTQEIDMRYCAIFFFTGVFVINGNPLFHIFLGLLAFFFLHDIHEAMAIVQETEENRVGEFHYQTSNGSMEDDAPAYIPLFTGTLMVVLLYYLLALPMPGFIEELVFLPFSNERMPLELWVVLLPFVGMAVYFYYRNKRAMKRGNDIIYRGFGDGDIYFFGTMIGILGFFFTLVVVFISMLPAYIQIHRRNHNRNRQDVGLRSER